jgi:4-hydroxy-3-polyprenylbenzoate decarboxylase
MRLIVGIAGASGVIYGIRALEILRQTGIETHLVMSPAAELTMSYETDVKPKAVREMATVYHPIGDVGASISSGSFQTMGMLILPCSIHTMSEIAHGITSNLLSSAAVWCWGCAKRRCIPGTCALCCICRKSAPSSLRSCRPSTRVPKR